VHPQRRAEARGGGDDDGTAARLLGAHDADFYEKTLRGILDAGIPFDSVCFKDASGTACPQKVHETIRRARKMLPEGTFQARFHTHDTAGTCVHGLQGRDRGRGRPDRPRARPRVRRHLPARRHHHVARPARHRLHLDIDIDKVIARPRGFKDA
jgi:hypothetical protein